MDNLIQMIEEINEAVDNSLSITYYTGFWELHSYKRESLFAIGRNKKRLMNISLLELIKEAYSMIKEDRILYRKFSFTGKNEIL